MCGSLPAVIINATTDVLALFFQPSHCPVTSRPSIFSCVFSTTWFESLSSTVPDTWCRLRCGEPSIHLSVNWRTSGLLAKLNDEFVARIIFVKLSAYSFRSLADQVRVLEVEVLACLSGHGPTVGFELTDTGTWLELKDVPGSEAKGQENDGVHELKGVEGAVEMDWEGGLFSLVDFDCL